MMPGSASSRPISCSTRASGSSAAVRATPIATWGLVTSLARRTASMPGDFGRRAEALVDREGRAGARSPDRRACPAARACHARMPACGSCPNGEAYYAWALKAGTTTTRSPDEVHAQGLEQLRALQSEMDAILRRQGLTQGTCRRADDRARPRTRASSSPTTMPAAGNCSTSCGAAIADMRTRLPRAFATLVPGNLVVKRVPPEIEIGAPGAYAGAGNDRRHGAGQSLRQSARHQREPALRPVHPRLSRGHSGPCLAGRIYVSPAPDPLIACLQRLFGRLGALCRAAWRRARLLRGRSAGQARLSPVDCLSRLPAGRRHRPSRQALDARACDRVVRHDQRIAPRRRRKRGRPLLRLAGPGLRLQGRP